MYGYNRHPLVTTHNTRNSTITVVWNQPQFIPPPVHHTYHHPPPIYYHYPPIQQHFHYPPHVPPPQPPHVAPVYPAHPAPAPAPPPVLRPVHVPQPVIPVFPEKKTPTPSYKSSDEKKSSSSGSRHEKARSTNLDYRSRPFGESNDTMPQLFLVAPPLDDPFVEGVSKPFRLLIPCQAPSRLPGAHKESIHLTHHEGFVVRNPKDLVSKCKGLISYLDAISAYVFMGAAAAGSAHGFQINGEFIQGSLNRLHQVAQNRDRLNRAGIEASRFYSKQKVVDNHQIDAMKALLRSANLTEMDFGVRPIHFGGPTKWVCEECYQVLSESRSIVPDHLMSMDEYIDLTRRATEANVVLRCSASVITFLRTIQKSPYLRKVTIQIKSGYFVTPDRLSGTQYNAIKHQFEELGKALQSRPLLSVEIKGDSGCGGAVFAGLYRVLKCSDLKTLKVTGMAQFLAELADLRGITHKLEEITLDGVRMDTAEAATRFSKLIQASSGLKILSLSRTRLSAGAVAVLASGQDKQTEKRFAKLVQLNLPDNDFDAATARALVAMALKGDRLNRLDLGNCRGVGDMGCRQILELLRVRGRRLDSIVMDSTGISYETSVEMDRYRSRRV
ncbi:hypothetical protein BGX31_004249 [Mortierella sp. GBA43]|nr:hypothetical protein BGX31_004249 [Mortierella sp. GBA43]